jgi:hypothetical protein
MTLLLPDKFTLPLQLFYPVLLADQRFLFCADHLSTAVPCYKIESCHLESPQGMFDNVIKVDARMALRSFFLVMWDEETRTYVPFDTYKPLVNALAPAAA